MREGVVCSCCWMVATVTITLTRVAIGVAALSSPSMGMIESKSALAARRFCWGVMKTL